MSKDKYSIQVYTKTKTVVAQTARSDWLVKFGISFAIYLRATREKVECRFASVTSVEARDYQGKRVNQPYRFSN